MAYSRELKDQVAQAQDVFVWETRAWQKYDRRLDWYLWMSGGAILLALYGIFTANYLFSFIIILIAIILILAGNEDPHPVLVQIGDNGVVVDGRLYLFENLDTFSIIYQPPETKLLYIEHRRSVFPRLRIDLEDVDPVSLRDFLRQYLKEDLDLRDEHLSDTFARLLRL